VSRHWSKISPGDVVQTAASSWTRVDRLDLSIAGLVAVVGRDVGGPGRDVQVTRWLNKGHLVSVRERVSLIGSGPDHVLSWTRRSVGLWVSGSYEVRRDRAGAPWEALRDGESMGSIRSLVRAKRACEVDHESAAARFLRGEVVRLVDFLPARSSSADRSSASQPIGSRRRS